MKIRDEVTYVEPDEDQKANIRTRDWIRAIVILGGILLVVVLLIWLNFGPRAT